MRKPKVTFVHRLCWLVKAQGGRGATQKGTVLEQESLPFIEALLSFRPDGLRPGADKRRHYQRQDSAARGTGPHNMACPPTRWP